MRIPVSDEYAASLLVHSEARSSFEDMFRNTLASELHMQHHNHIEVTSIDHQVRATTMNNPRVRRSTPTGTPVTVPCRPRRHGTRCLKKKTHAGERNSCMITQMAEAHRKLQSSDVGVTISYTVVCGADGCLKEKSALEQLNNQQVSAH